MQENMFTGCLILNGKINIKNNYFSLSLGNNSTKLQGLWLTSNWCFNIPSHASVTPPEDPGNANIYLPLDKAAQALDCIEDVPTVFRLIVLKTSPNPGICLSAISLTASGVISLPVRPVPPVVIITSISFWLVHSFKIFTISSLLSLQIFLSINLCLASLIFSTKGQCDVAITGVNLETYEITIEVINSVGCIAAPIGGTPGKVSQIQIGYHLPEPINPDNELIEDFNETFGLPPCSPQWDANGYYLGMNPNNNHPGWRYSPSTSTTFTSEIMGDGLVTGDIINIPLNPPGDYDTYPTPTAECGDDLIDYWLSEDECIEFVVWQLNYGSTWYTGNGGWATLASNPDFAPGTYQDQNCNNSWYMCRDENPGAAVASPDFDCPPDAPDAIIDNISASFSLS